MCFDSGAIVSVPAWGATICSDAGAVVRACDCLHWMLSIIVLYSAGAGHACEGAWCQVHGCGWSCRCAADIGAM